VKVLLDECVDWRLGRDIVGHDVKTARQMGWAAIKNGELLALAEKQFEVSIETFPFNKTSPLSRSPSLCFTRRRIGLPN
jgi:hypothetical protein